MARSREEGEIWGTWEELLLACAVNRHGTHSWDSVAMELRSRTTPSYAHRLTPDLCRNRYRHLHLRFTGGDGTDGGNETPDGDPTAKIPWLDELRELRVAELRQALDRSDVSIGTLQLKVRRLKEERERSLKEPESAGDGRSGSGPVEEEKRKERIRLPGLFPGGGSDGSCRESNSTEKKPEPDPDPDPKAVTGSGSDRGGREASYNGSTGGGAVRSPAEEANPVNESGESVAETKESSDVQSSASLSRRRRRRGRRRMPSVTVASDEPEAADGVSSPVREPVDSESQPLISFLDMIRSTKDGPVFERRLESQETESYGSIVRRHVDLEIIQGRIRRIGYTSAELFRDLLLLCTNATVYFPKSSRESIAAVHIRDLVTREISSTLGEPTVPSPPSVKEPTSLPAQHSPPVPPNSDPKPNTPPLPDKKPIAPLPPLVACRKRSSIKPALKKNEKSMLELIIDEKDKVEKKKKKKAMPEFIIDEEEEEKSEKEEEDVVDKKITKQQRSALARGLRTNKTRSGSKVVAEIATEAPKEKPESKVEQETKPSAAKKRSAANFLNRMKRSVPSSSNDTLLLDDLNITAASGRGSDLPKKKSREVSRKEKEKEESTAVKRTVGRPPKRVPAKRRREEKTTVPTAVKKRARR